LFGACALIQKTAGLDAALTQDGEKRSNDTHESTTDPDARLYRKGPGMEAKLCFIGHGLMESRSALIVDTRVTAVDGHAERIAALAMFDPRAGSAALRHRGDRQGLRC
jgi:hypothetical protein